MYTSRRHIRTTLKINQESDTVTHFYSQNPASKVTIYNHPDNPQIRRREGMFVYNQVLGEELEMKGTPTELEEYLRHLFTVYRKDMKLGAFSGSDLTDALMARFDMKPSWRQTVKKWATRVVNFLFSAGRVGLGMIGFTVPNPPGLIPWST
ncbi:UNVERIFIED_CONTAM: hypothetical protein HDU68_009868 [Siphonaria sp. JEL0065]|nr:hypothetical protein HDU68_009868 [Siphonaria sp. JEL0065]